MGRLLIFLALLLLAYLLLRRLSRPQEITREPPYTVIDADSIPDDDEAEARTSPLQIRDFGFRQIDSVAGPPDPNCFYDELLVELYDPNSGREWRNSYMVATPAGIAKIMKEEGWEHMFGHELLIVQRFDMKGIRDAVLGHGEERFDLLPEDVDDQAGG
jgi:hypothetical protein